MWLCIVSALLSRCLDVHHHQDYLVRAGNYLRPVVAVLHLSHRRQVAACVVAATSLLTCATRVPSATFPLAECSQPGGACLFHPVGTVSVCLISPHSLTLQLTSISLSLVSYFFSLSLQLLLLVRCVRYLRLCLCLSLLEGATHKHTTWSCRCCLARTSLQSVCSD